ncbi:transient receptor potential cation channel subfamily M member 3-like isoform X2 [Watersipora subatra]|uniref:transient receptor potential cation channel subfamily M member 3-like isoform X2 n=1 Tax=Watersipora subatra TaxID=2589382 RepID=UPI00355B3B74
MEMIKTSASNGQRADEISIDDSIKSSVVNIPSKVRDFWIEKTFNRRYCTNFTKPTNNAERDRCACGHHRLEHDHDAIVSPRGLHVEPSWQAAKHTSLAPTNAFGQIDFQGASCYATKAQYVRLEHLTSPEKILQLLLHHWRLELPKLLISVHGGIANFDLQPKLNRVFKKGLIKAANTTGAWIITGGTNTGVMRHVGSALAEKSIKKHKKHIVAIGIAPWGVVHKRTDLIGRDKAVNYHAAAHPKTNTAVLNSRHNYFLLADNGTEGKYGADIVLRKQLERYISHQRIHIRGEKPMRGRGVPIVCVVLEGGSNTIRTVLDYLTVVPPVPVVVCDGSGRAADLLAFVHKYTNDEGTLPSTLKEQLISTIKKTFSYGDESAARVYYELVMCMKRKKLITIFRMGEQCQDIDLPILTALLTSQNTSAPQQLTLALSWDRVDVARSHIFTYGQDWPEGSLQQAMLEALVQNKVDFVELLLEKGVNMSKFLTINNLEELYNTKIGSTSTLHMMLRDVQKYRHPNDRVSLLDVGLVLEKLMGGAYRSRYCRRKFKSKYYQATRNKYPSINKGSQDSSDSPFPFPFSDLMIWAVLLKRQKMAKFMWRREEEALVKAIVACKLYKSLAREAIDEPLVDNEVSIELTEYGREFQKLALDILDHSYKEDDDLAYQLLTYELKSFSNQTCISLAHSATMRDFIAHPCCQTLISDMWMGGLRMNKSSTYKILLGILVPFTIIRLDFKSKEELQLLPQTEEEHIDELEDDESSEDSNSETDLKNIDNNSIIDNYADHADEVNKMITWAPVDESEPRNEVGELDKPEELPDSSFFNSSTLQKLKELRRRHQELKLGKKVSEFYKAPVTKFWMHTMAYLIFLGLYNYMLMMKIERPWPSWQEIYVLVYVFFHGIEMIREIFVSEPSKFSHKVAVFFSDAWNIMDMFSLPTFWAAVVLSFQEDKEWFLTGRVLYSVNIIFWYIRILELFAVSKNLGPYVVIIGKLIVDMLNFIVILLIVLMSFGVARQSLRNPYPEGNWQSARDIFLEPYFMLYGEVYAGDIDPPCGNGTGLECLPGRWITPLIMSAYLLVANILLLNLLIAVFNNTYQRISQNSREIWMFQRYSLTLEYEIKPLFPAPLIIFSFIYLICKWIRRRCKHSRKIQDYGLKLFLTDDEVRRLHDFEEDCVDDYFNTLELQFESSTDERIKSTNQRVENIMLKMDDINQKENQVKLSMQAMEMRISHLEDLDGKYMIRRYEMESSDEWYDCDTSPHVDLDGNPCGFTTENFDRIQRGRYLASQNFSNSSGEQFPMDSVSSGNEAEIISPHAARASFFKARSRHNSAEEDFSQRLSNKKGRLVPDGVRSSLLRRRRGSDLKPLKTTDSLSDAVPGVSASLQPCSPESVNSNYGDAQGYLGPIALPSIVESLQPTPTYVESSTQPCSQSADSTEDGSNSHRKLISSHSLPVPTTGHSSKDSGSVSHHSSHKSLLASPRLHSARSVTDSHLQVPPDPYSVAFVPVKPTHRNEYTSITDAIDTSTIDLSPESSPNPSCTSCNRFYFGPNMDSSDADRFFPTVSKDTAKDILEQESESHKRAEEHETQVLGKSIRKRIRQISVDDSNVMSDIAQQYMNDLDSESPTLTADELEDSGTGGDLASTLPASLFKNGETGVAAGHELSQSNHF